MSSDISSRRKAKPNVSKACVNCRKAHLACNEERPCKRCMSLNKQDTCFDVDHKKRGRPKAQPNKPKPPKQTSYLSLPIIHPYSAQSSFKMTDNSHTSTPVQNTPIATMLLTMDLCCARLSDEINDLLGYYPQEMTHRSLYTFVTSDSNESLSRIHRHLLDNVVYTAQKVDPHYRYIHAPPAEHSTSERFFEQNPQTLCSIANGSQSFTSMLYLKNSSGNIECLQSQFCLGGGLGADLLNPSTLGSLYIICLLSKASDVPLSTPSPSALSTSSLPEQQPISVPLIPADQWNMAFSESPPLPSQTIQHNRQQLQSQFHDPPQQILQNQSQYQQKQQLQQQPQQQLSQHYLQHPPYHTPYQHRRQSQQPPPQQQQPQQQRHPQGNFGFINNTIPYIQQRGSMQNENESYSLSPAPRVERESNTTYTDTSMTNSTIKEKSSALSCPRTSSSKKNNDEKREFFKNDSVIHVAPTSGSKEKPPLFENQTSTLFRALVKDKTVFTNVGTLSS